MNELWSLSVCRVSCAICLAADRKLKNVESAFPVNKTFLLLVEFTSGELLQNFQHRTRKHMCLYVCTAAFVEYVYIDLIGREWPFHTITLYALSSLKNRGVFSRGNRHLIHTKYFMIVVIGNITCCTFEQGNLIYVVQRFTQLQALDSYPHMHTHLTEGSVFLCWQDPLLAPQIPVEGRRGRDLKRSTQADCLQLVAWWANHMDEEGAVMFTLCSRFLLSVKLGASLNEHCESKMLELQG